MEKQFVITLGLIAAWYILFKTPFLLVLLSGSIAFIFLGMIPFIGYTAPPEVMFLIYMAAGAALVIFANETGYYPFSPRVRKAVRMANVKVARNYDRRIARLDKPTRAYRRTSNVGTTIDVKAQA